MFGFSNQSDSSPNQPAIQGRAVFGFGNKPTRMNLPTSVEVDQSNWQGQAPPPPSNGIQQNQAGMYDNQNQPYQASAQTQGQTTTFSLASQNQQQPALTLTQGYTANDSFFGTSGDSKWAHDSTPINNQNQWNAAQQPTFNQNQWNAHPQVETPVQTQDNTHSHQTAYPSPQWNAPQAPPVVQDTPFVKIQDVATDSSIYAATSFEELNLRPELLKGLYAMHFSKPSKIQEEALPALLKNPPDNIICQSQSGNGKTIAFVLAMLQRVDVNIKAPQSICLAPTRELARQLHEVIVQMSKFIGVSTGLVVKESMIRLRPITEQIIVGTPGTVLGALNKRNINTNQIRTFVLDEADNMLEQEGGLGEQSIRVKQRITSSGYQMMMFSATFSDRMIHFAETFAPGAKKMLLVGDKQVTDNIKQMYMDCNSLEHKYEVLCNLYELLHVSQSIIFCKTRETAARISEQMIAQGHKVKYLHAGLTADERDNVIDEFRRGEFKVLISTNVVSRGIDITQISLVINYDTPLTLYGDPDMDVYVHRIGRTGRFGRNGCSICFVHDEKTWREINEIERHLNQRMYRVPTDDWEEVAKIFKKFLY